MRRAHRILMQKEEVELSTGPCRAQDRETLQFLYKNGYYRSFSSYLMERKAPAIPVGSIAVRQYEDRDYPTWHRISSMAFYEVRVRAGVLPSYYWPADEGERKSLLERKQDCFVMLDKGEIVAVGRLTQMSWTVLRCAATGREEGMEPPSLLALSIRF